MTLEQMSYMHEPEDGKSPSCQEASLVSRSVWPGGSAARTMTVISGLKCIELSENSNPVGCLEKTLMGSYEWASTKRYLTWRTKATPSGRLVFRLWPSERITKDNERLLSDAESMLWATPNTMDHLGRRSPEALIRQKETTRKGRKRPANLREQVDPVMMQIWRTPTAHDYRGASSQDRTVDRKNRGMPLSLNDQVKHQELYQMQPSPLFITPVQSDGMRSTMKSQSLAKQKPNGNLAQQMAHLELKTGEAEEPMRNKNSTTYCGGGGCNIPEESGQLNPWWLEWLMGFPTGWTALKD